MTDKELVAALRRNMVETGSLICLGCGYEYNCSTKGCAVMREAAERIEAGQWIPVTERMPEDDGRVVVLPQDGMLYHIEEIAEIGERWVGNKPIQKITFTCGFGLVGIPFDFSQIGKTVFLTRAEAESALKGENDG